MGVLSLPQAAVPPSQIGPICASQPMTSEEDWLSIAEDLARCAIASAVTVRDETPSRVGAPGGSPASGQPGRHRHGEHHSVIVNIAQGLRSTSSVRPMSIRSDVRYS